MRKLNRCSQRDLGQLFMLSNEEKRLALDWITLINNDERYYFVKALDLFYAFPIEIQRRMVIHYARAAAESWSYDDDLKLLDSMKSILHYYTGEKALAEPSKIEFLTLFKEFIIKEIGHGVSR